MPGLAANVDLVAELAYLAARPAVVTFAAADFGRWVVVAAVVTALLYFVELAAVAERHAAYPSQKAVVASFPVRY